MGDDLWLDSDGDGWWHDEADVSASDDDVWSEGVLSELARLAEDGDGEPVDELALFEQMWG